MSKRHSRKLGERSCETGPITSELTNSPFVISCVYIPFKTLVTLELKKKHSLFSLLCGCIKIFV